MLAALAFLLAAVSNDKHSRHLKRASSDLAGERQQPSRKQRVPRKTPPEAAGAAKERPTHFLSVRVQNTDIWRKVNASRLAVLSLAIPRFGFVRLGRCSM